MRGSANGSQGPFPLSFGRETVTLAGPAPVSQLSCSERPGPRSFQANPPTLCGSAPYLACQLEAAVVLLSVGDEWDFSLIPPANQA